MAAPPQQSQGDAGGGALSYVPEPHERPYFDGLFQAADTDRSGRIGGQQAVAFFSRSKLPIQQLKNVWTVADNPPSNELDKRKFTVALRLIQLLQNGVKGQGANLAAPPGVNLRPVFFEGVSGVSVQMPNQQQQQPQQQAASQQQRPPVPVGPPQHGPPGGSPRAGQTQQQPSQQQQQPPQQQHGGRPPMPPQASQSPARGTAPGGSMALTVQDPYTLTPSELARYESLFPEYAREDGFMHGKEAVELFSKSGLNHGQLRDIWNLVDQPVDNRLDKLEFAIAMHLIVCVSKKNLPLPKALPISLKSLKDQQKQQPGIQGSPSWTSQQGMSQDQHQQMQQQQQQQYPQQQMQPSMQQQKQQQPQKQNPMEAAPPNRIGTPTNESVMSGMTGPSTLQGPPPIVSSGGVDISDAFEGLSTASGAHDHGSAMQPTTNGFESGFGSFNNVQQSAQQSYGESTNKEQQTSGMGTGMNASANHEEQRSTNAESEATPKIASPPRIQETISGPGRYQMSGSNSQPAPEEPKSAEALTRSYDMEDAHGELGKLKTVLQKLQAENISLKAQLGSMSEEEKDVHKQINAVVHEISELSSQLTNLRAQVLSSRSRLLEKTAELKAAQEKKGTLKDLIGEAEATQEAIESAYQGLEDSIHAAKAPASQPTPAPAPSYEQADLFGFGNMPAPAPAQTPSYDSTANAEVQHQDYAAPAPFPVSQPASGPAPVPRGQQGNQVETVSEDDTSAAEGEDFEENPDGEHEDSTQQHNNHYGQDHSEMRSAEQDNVFRQGSSNAPYGSGLEAHFRTHAPQAHNKQASISSQLSFDRDGIMGGAPIPASQFSPPPQAENHYETAIQNAPSLDDVEDLKRRAKEAGNIARDAEESLRQLMAQADEYRSVADQAEMEARAKMSQAAEKKGGFMGGGGKKKKSMKEADKAKQDAEEKKKKFLAAQSQAHDAQAVAMETKREAEKLRKEAEKAEMDAAAAASMQYKQPAPALPSQASNGEQPNRQAYHDYDYQEQQKNYGQHHQQNQGHSHYQQQQSYGQHQHSGYGNPYAGGFQGQPLGESGGYNPSVMQGDGGGGVEIPTPSSGGNDPYSNPFA